MLEQIEKPNGRTSIQDAVNMVGRAARTKLDLEEWKNKAGHMIEDSVDDAKRMAKKARYAAEDLVDDTQHMIKKEPFRAVGIMFGAGVGIGMLTGWLIGRMTHHCREEVEH